MTRKSAEVASDLLRTIGKSFSCFPSVEGGWRVQVWDFDGTHTFSRLVEVRAYVAKHGIVEAIITENSRPRRKAMRVVGQYVVGHNARHEALCLCWEDKAPGQVDKDMLHAIYQEARALGYRGPIHVYGATSLIGETETYRFIQVAA